jgi:hypothetical protein
MAQPILPDYYGEITAAEKNGRKRGALSAAEAYAQGGDLESAQKAAAIYAPEAAQAYEGQADKAYGRDFAGALANEDFTGAAQAAGKYGDAKGVVAAQGALKDHKDEQVAQAAAALGRAANQLDAISQMGSPEQITAAYTDYYGQIKEAVSKSGGDAQFLSAFPDPKEFNPASARALSKRAYAQVLSAKDYIEAEAKTRQIDLTEFNAREDARHNRVSESIDWTNARTAAGKPARTQYYPDAAASAGNFANRLVQADKALKALEAKGLDFNAVYTIGQIGAGGADVQRYRQAQREFINAILRKESGAAIGNTEFDSAKQQYFPVPGDKPETIAAKQAARLRSAQGLINQSQGYYDEFYPGGGAGAGAGDPAAGGAPDPLGIR